jgi:TM2 domain-containing membrane protein YozV
MGYQSQSLMQDDDLRGSTERTQRRILVETTIANQKKSVGIAYLLWFFFGGFGLHNFYLGKTGLGAAQLGCLVLGWAANFAGAPLFALPLFGFVIISLLFDLCFIPARVHAHTERMRESLSDSMIWSD